MTALPIPSRSVAPVETSTVRRLTPAADRQSRVPRRSAARISAYAAPPRKAAAPAGRSRSPPGDGLTARCRSPPGGRDRRRPSAARVRGAGVATPHRRRIRRAPPRRTTRLPRPLRRRVRVCRPQLDGRVTAIGDSLTQRVVASGTSTETSTSGLQRVGESEHPLEMSETRRRCRNRRRAAPAGSRRDRARRRPRVYPLQRDDDVVLVGGGHRRVERQRDQPLAQSLGVRSDSGTPPVRDTARADAPPGSAASPRCPLLAAHR